MLDVKKAIKHLILDQNIKISDLAARLDMKPQALSNWLYRSDIPKVSTADEMLEKLGCRLAIIDKDGNILF